MSRIWLLPTKQVFSLSGVAALLLGATLLVASTPAAASSANVVPAVTCVTLGHGHNYTAYFGYSNSGSAANYPDGSSNQITPSKYDGNQPTSFISGTVTNAFSVQVHNQSVTWTVAGQSATATSSSTTCSGSSLPVDPLGLSLVIAIGLGVLIGVVVIRRTAKRKATS
jgi:hypothetical protein